MQFSKLRLVGFKSFVEATELLIAPGMTGVVGPNGCGKSNLVEALRWVMGETSARNMRGGEMDDVIFAGSATRPARNHAEVLLTLDNGEGRAPAPFQDAPEIAVSRRITRASGSDYRINGAPVRARDVQLLFADLATGARSTAIVSQGRISALISARPTERRLLLEEAAGITGLHSRRHEAELRLKGAETNLERLDDVTGQLDGQLGGLKRQARQAVRYRNLSASIRQAEAIMHHLRFQAALAELNAARAALDAVQAAVTEATRGAATASTIQADLAARMEPLRRTEVERGAALQRLLVAREALDQEEARLREMVADLERRLKQYDVDVERERRRQAEAQDRVATLLREQDDLGRKSAGEDEAQAAARARVEQANSTVAEAEAAQTAATERLADLKARRQAAARALSEATTRRDTVARRLEGTDRELATATDSGLEARIAAAEQALERARTELAEIAGQVTEAEARRPEAEAALEAAVEAQRVAKARVSALDTEIATLTRMLGKVAPDGRTRVLDLVRVAPGLEAAFTAALGSGVDGALEPDAAARWTRLDPADLAGPLPEGVPALSDHVEAPVELARRLASVGVVAGRDEGDRLAPGLRPGQRLVSRAGDLWRWDGFSQRAGAKPDAGAIRLEQQNRLAALTAERDPAAAALIAAEDGLTAARSTVARVIDAEREARGRRARAETAQADASRLLETHRRQAETERRRQEGLRAAREGLSRDLDEARAAVESLQAEFTALPSLDAAERGAGETRATTGSARQALDQARADLDRLERERRFRRRRMEEIAREKDDWSARAAESLRTVEEIDARRRDTATALDDLAHRPAEIAEQRAGLARGIDEAEAARRAAAEALSGAERELGDADRALRAAQAALQVAREDLARREAAVAHGEQDLRRLADTIREAMECPPTKVLEAAGIDADAELPGLGDVERSLERLKRERENMGPVNLRAEIEAQEVQEKLDTLAAERADLEGAIQRLRQGIHAINREARARLMTAFEAVNGHFTALFQRIFGGGEARLALTEAEDPLQAGLEIMASPPGKRMQVLTLLSGGEQALTATALLFAVFLTNPAPICVLDELDAPLDDANVERLMDMLEDIAGRGGTRFLVITHNPITMARMDRLFGVTMGERGVSQLVSVDLAAAAALRESA